MANVVTCPAASDATAVLRQKRRCEYADGTLIGAVPRLTEKNVPESELPGRPPSAGGLNRGSCHVPVQVGGSAGSITAFACVSL